MAQSEQPGVAKSPTHIWGLAPELASSKLFSEYIYRLTSGRDMHVIITAASETGVGKTTLAVVLALLWDQHGWTADKAAVADARHYDNLYDEVPPGSVLILDEAEKAVDARRGASKENVDLSQSFAAKRFKQVFGIMTAPSKSWVDKRMGSDAADYWIQAHETDQGEPKGEATVYRLRESEHYGSSYTPKTETIAWPKLEENDEFRELDRIKREKLTGVTQSNYVHRDKVDELKKNYWNKASKMTRYHLVKAMAEHGITQTKISEILTTAEHVEGLSQQRVSQFVNSSDFEEVYST